MALMIFYDLIRVGLRLDKKHDHKFYVFILSKIFLRVKRISKITLPECFSGVKLMILKFYFILRPHILTDHLQAFEFGIQHFRLNGG